MDRHSMETMGPFTRNNSAMESTANSSDGHTVLPTEEIPLINLTHSVEALSLASRNVDFYMPIVLAVVGGICNSLVIRVMMTSYFSNVSTSLYMTFNAVFDNVSLLIALPVHWLHVNFPHVIYRGEHRDVICMVIHFLGMATSDIGVLLTAAMTCERALAIKFPLKAAMFCTTKKAKYVTCIMILVIILKDGPVMVKSQMVPITMTSYLCELDKTDASFANYANNIEPAIHNVFLIVCFLAIVFSNVVIVKSVQRSHRRHGDSTLMESTNYHRRTNARTRQLTMMLISDSVTIICCTLPFAILNAITLNVSFVNQDVRHMVYAITFYLLYVNRCANFFLYCVSGQRFRQALKGLFLKRSHRQSVFSIRASSNGAAVNDNRDATLSTQTSS